MTFENWLKKEQSASELAFDDVCLFCYLLQPLKTTTRMVANER